MTLLALALAVLATAPGGGAVPGAPHDARILAVRGLPPDADVRHRFTEAFTAELGASELAVERGAGDAWSEAQPLANGFRFADDADADSAWSVTVSIGSPRPVTRRIGNSRRQRASYERTAARGLLVAVAAAPPGTAAEPEERLALVFPPPPPPPGTSFAVPRAGYRFPWEEAGRAVARLVLEDLHHRSGALPSGTRAALAPAVRAGEAEMAETKEAP